MKVSRGAASDVVMDRSRRVLAGPQIAAGRVGLAGEEVNCLVFGRAEASSLSGVVCGPGCQLALGLWVGVVDPGAKRRFWD
jgi:hypothetical protein